MYYYGARWYDTYLNHVTQPDTIVPDPYNPQSYDRFSYALNNPLRYTDPTGHMMTVDDGGGGGSYTPPAPNYNYCTYNPWACGGYNNNNNGGGGGGGGGAGDDYCATHPGACGGNNNGGGGGGSNSGNGSEGCNTLVCIINDGGSGGGQLAPVSYPSIDISSYCGGGPNGWYDFFDCGANITQDLALLIDTPFAGLEAVLIVAGCFSGLQGCAAGAAAGIAVFNVSGANIHETYISGVSAVFSIAADYADDQHFGEGTVVTATTVVLGTLSLDPIADFAIDGFGSAYNHDVKPISSIPSLIGSLFNH